MDKPPRVIVFESRLSAELSSLARRHGLDPIVAPALEEVPIDEQPEARAFADVLVAGGCDVLLLLTGVGAVRLFDTLSLAYDREQWLEALRSVALVCRGSKPAGVLKAIGVRPTLTAPAPNTRSEVLSALDAELPIAGKRVYVQEYGERDELLLEALAARGAAFVGSVPVYAYALPSDTAPLEAAIDTLIAGDAEAALFTSRAQVHNLFRVAKEGGRADALTVALNQNVAVGSVGPVTTEGLATYGVVPSFEPTNAKMGPLVMGLARSLSRLSRS